MQRRKLKPRDISNFPEKSQNRELRENLDSYRLTILITIPTEHFICLPPFTYIFFHLMLTVIQDGIYYYFYFIEKATGSEVLSQVLKVIQSVSSRNQIQTQMCI